MQASLEKCDFGKHLNEECRLDHYNKKEPCLLKLNSLDKDIVEILILRTPGIDKKLKNFEINTICNHHYDKMYSYYASHQRKCCDPWSKHKVAVKVNLTEIDFDLRVKSKFASKLDLIPGKKICNNCCRNLYKEIEDYEKVKMCCVDPYKRHREKVSINVHTLDKKYIVLNQAHNLQLQKGDKICCTCETMLETELLKSKEENSSDDKSESQFTESTPGSIYESSSQKRKTFDETLSYFQMPPFKRQKLSNDRLAAKGVEVIENIVSQVSKSFEEAHSVQLPDLKNLSQLSKENLWFQSMIANMKLAFENSKTFNEKVSLLTLLPNDWNLKDVSSYFKCSYHMLSECKKLKQNSGTLAIRKRKSYFRISEEMRNEITQYYLDTSNSIMCSGMKECVTVKCPGQESISIQKQILIYDIQDLYKNWIKESSHEKVPCLAFFTTMRPIQCVIAGEPGTHNVCVCQIHQNVKLKIAAFDKEIHYSDLIEVGVCSVESKNCMLNNCDECPKKDGILEFLKTNPGIENFESVKYTNWGSAPTSENSSMNRVTLEEFDEPIADFLGNLSQDIHDMIPHHFISAKQKEFFDYCKQNLANDTGILIMDFAENYSFLCQNSTQGFYFSNSQATLFTAALYYKEATTSKLKVATYCVISKSTIHQAYSVNVFMQDVLSQAKQEFPWINKLIEFSDGAPTQFKNKNHFSNLCNHEETFGFTLISYNFFATSHGKNVCDGIGATAKRLARKASKQGINIMTAKQMYNYLSNCESNIRYSFVEEATIIARGKTLEARFKSAKTVTNTRLYHSITPIDKKTLRLKQFSFDTDYVDFKLIS